MNQLQANLAILKQKTRVLQNYTNCLKGLTSQNSRRREAKSIGEVRALTQIARVRTERRKHLSAMGGGKIVVSQRRKKGDEVPISFDTLNERLVLIELFSLY